MPASLIRNVQKGIAGYRTILRSLVCLRSYVCVVSGNLIV